MKKALSKITIEIPAMEATMEGKLHGGFTTISDGNNISVCGGPNKDCKNNPGGCYDNYSCYNNIYSGACSGNPEGGSCSNHGTATSTSTSSSTSRSMMATDLFNQF